MDFVLRPKWGICSQLGFVIQKNVTLEDLNSLYFGPVDRTLPEDQILKLEHLLIAATSALTPLLNGRRQVDLACC